MNAIREALVGFYKRNRLRIWLTVLSAVGVYVGGLSVLVSGDVMQNAQAMMLLVFRGAALVFWYFISGWLIDFANGVGFHEDKKRIDDGNVAVALSRSIGFAVIFGSGAVLLARL